MSIIHTIRNQNKIKKRYIVTVYVNEDACDAESRAYPRQVIVESQTWGNMMRTVISDLIACYPNGFVESIRISHTITPCGGAARQKEVRKRKAQKKAYMVRRDKLTMGNDSND